MAKVVQPGVSDAEFGGPLGKVRETYWSAALRPQKAAMSRR
jgi:hypothetical protein